MNIKNRTTGTLIPALVEKDVSVFQEEKEELEKELMFTEDRRKQISLDHRQYSLEKAADILETLKKIKPRKATKEGNLSMYDYLVSLKDEYERCADAKEITGRIAEDIAQMDKGIEECHKRISGIHSQLGGDHAR